MKGQTAYGYEGLGLCVLLVLSFVSPILISIQAHASMGSGIHLSLNPGYLVQGGICQVVFLPDKGYEITWAGFEGKPLVLKELGHHRYLALVGAGLREKPGRKILRIRLHTPNNGIKTIVRHIQVKRKDYPEEHLKVPGKMVEFSPRTLRRVLADQKAVRQACSKITNKIYWKRPFVWPVESKILSPFGLRRFFNGKPRSPHSGIDLRARANTPIKAPSNGKVALVRNCYLSGNTVVVDHGGGLFTLYAHLSKVMVRRGQKVQRGQVIGLSGATGRATGPHLHWGVSLMGVRVDPVQLMKLMGH